MPKQFSINKYEHKVLPGFRKKISDAESTEDIKKFFVYAAKELFENIFKEDMDFKYDDIMLAPEQTPRFILSDRLLASKELKSVWRDSDLRHVMDRLSESATRRYRHLEKHREKTEAKIRM